MMSPSYTQDCRAHVGVWARALVKKGTDDGPLDVEEGEPEAQAAQELRRRQFHGTWCYSDKPSCKSPKDLLAAPGPRRRRSSASLPQRFSCQCSRPLRKAQSACA